MPAKWSEIAQSEQFQSLPAADRQAVRGDFFERVIRPAVPADKHEAVSDDFFTATEADVFGNGSVPLSQKPEAPKPKAPDAAEDDPGFFESTWNSVQGAGDRAMDLAGNAMQFVGNSGEWREDATKDWPVVGKVVDYLNPDAANDKLRDWGQALQDQDAGYEENFTWQKVKDEPSLSNITGFITEQGIRSAPDMAAAVAALPAYVVTRAQELGEERARNDGLTTEDGELAAADYAKGLPPALGSALLDRFGAKGMLGLGQKPVQSMRRVPGAVAKAATKEAGTEAAQESIEYVGTNAGTEAGFDLAEMGDRAMAGAVAGAGMGGVVRAGTGATEALSDGSESAPSTPQERPESATGPADETTTTQSMPLDPESIEASIDLIAQPRHRLDGEQRAARDSVTDGQGFDLLRAEAQRRGDEEAAAELDRLGGDIGLALEEETLLRSQGGDTAALQPRLDALAQRYRDVTARVMDNAAPSASDARAETEPRRPEAPNQPDSEAETTPQRSPRERKLGIDNDIRVAEKVGADEDAVRLRNAKSLFVRAMEQDEAGNSDMGSRLRQRGLDIHREIYGDPESLMPERPSSFPVPYQFDGDLEPGGQYPGRPNAPRQPDTVEGTPDQRLQEPARRLRQGDQASGDSLIYGDGPTVQRGNADTGMDQPFDHARTTDTTQQAKPSGYDPTQAADTPKHRRRVQTSGKRAQAYLADNTPVPVRYRAMELDELTPSNSPDGEVNPSFPSELQPRDRTGKNSQVQVRNIAARLNPERLGESSDAGSGSPIVGPDGVVESGNGRTMGIAQAYRGDTPQAKRYRDFVRTRAEDFGIDPEVVNGMRNPVLVRERTGSIDRAEFARRANEADVASMTPFELAVSDADRLSVDDMAEWTTDEAGDPLAASNRGFTRRFSQRIGNNEASRYRSRDGQPTPELGERMQRAVFAKSYADNAGRPSPDMLEMVTERQGHLRNLKLGLQVAAPDFAVAREYGGGEATGMVDTVVDAVRIVRQARSSGMPVRDLVSQSDAFDAPVPRDTAALAMFIANNARSRKGLSDALSMIATATRSRAETSRNGALFGDSVTNEDITNAATREDPAQTNDGEPGIDGDTARGNLEGAGQAPRGKAVDRPEPAATEEGQVGDDSLLTTYDEQDLADIEQRQQRAEQEDTLQREGVEARARADAEANDFGLTGSDRTADVAAARGQRELGEEGQSNDQAPTAKRRNQPLEYTGYSGEPRSVRSYTEIGDYRIAKVHDGLHEVIDSGGQAISQRAGPNGAIKYAQERVKDGQGATTATETSEPNFEAEPLLRRDGSPFQTARQAEISKVARDAEREGKPVEIVPVGDGFGVRIPDTSAAQSYSQRRGGGRMPGAPKADSVNQALKGQRLGNVRVVDSPAELPRSAIDRMDRDRISPADVRGVYSDGSVYVVAGHHANVDDAVRTALHESVGHRGIRGVLGDQLDPIMDQVYESHQKTADGRSNLEAIARDYPFANRDTAAGRRVIAEELVANYLDGSFGRPAMHHKLVSKVREILRKMFPSIRWTTRDIQALGERSRGWLRRQDTQPGTREQRYSVATGDAADAATHDYSDDSAGFAIPDETLRERAIRKMQDKMGRLKKTVESINARGGRVTDENNAYLAEELFHGKIENDLRQMRETYVEPLAKKLSDYDITQEQLDNYLYARHAPERNAVIAQRNADMPDGGSGMTNADAAQILDEVQDSGKRAQYDEAAALVYGMLRESREAMRRGGLATDEMLNDWESAYQNYVPLKGNPKGEASGGGAGQGYNIGGKESKIAGGRRSRAESPSSHAIIDATQSLVRKRKNEVGNAMLSFVTDNPDPNLWQVFTEGSPDTERRPVEVSDGQGGKRIEVRDQPVPMHMSDKYFATKRAGRTYYIKIEDPLLMRAMKNLGPEDNNSLIRAAASTVRVMSALNTSYNPEFMLTNFARDVQTAILNLNAEQTREDGKAKGKQIAAQTARDVGTSMRAVHASLRGKRLTGKHAEWQRYFDEFQADGAKTGWYDMKDIEGQAKDIRRLMTMSGNSTAGRSLRYGRAVSKFVEDANSAVENAVRLSAYTNARKAGITREQAASLAKNMTVNFNRRGEVGTALNSAYMFANASIQGTANFVRTMGRMRGPEYGKGWGRLNTAQKLAVAMTAGGFALAQLNRWASEEDDDGVLFWDKIPDYVKERNIILMSSLWGGDGKDYVKIPLPYGYNIFSVLGTQAEAVVSGKKSLGEASKNFGLAAVGSFSPIGFEDGDSAWGLIGKNAAPSIVRPVAQLMDNSDFAGRMIYQEGNPYATPKPESSKSFKSTPEPYKQFAEFMNRVTGGSQFRSGAIDVNPDVMQHIVNFYGGGAWSFGDKVVNYATETAQGNEVQRGKIPFAGRFINEITPYADQSKFYERYNELGQFNAEFENSPPEHAREFYQANREKVALFPHAQAVRDTLTELRDIKEVIEASNQISKEEKEKRIEGVEARMKEQVDRFNRAYNEAEIAN
ncbi:LPD38 domain-containing protein [Salinicola halophilus]|uniref:LPD38 domain-containing protein n=1 Tax=Salinicola halophilus TaxID=184065 RepID=UPI000DA2688D|nr:LPD38 domain-containing protein [Salinicola halophilus]